FVAVWHTNDSLSDGRVADSTGRRDGTATAGLDATHVVTGPLGGAFGFGARLNTFPLANPFAGNSPHTISAWVNQRSGDGTFDAIVVVGNHSNEQSRWFYTNYQNPRVAVGLYGDDWNDTTVAVNNAGWTLLHWTYA